MQKYNKYISEMAQQTNGWWWLSLPIIGWIFAMLMFGFYLPLRYFWDNGNYKSKE